MIDLEDEEEIDDVEKEVIDLGDTPKKDKEEGAKRAAELKGKNLINNFC